MSDNVGDMINWMAPETLDAGGLASAEGDVWAFGMTILQFFSRKKPFHDCSSAIAVMCDIVQGWLPDQPHVTDTDFPMTDDWWDICLQCWAYSPLSHPTMSHLTEVITKIVCQLAVDLKSLHHD
ncbi:hypothetical protein ID866_12230 [Astraeus odoratus]|nr:hypothetical protein ID866_12230 [Astraeus odoratus]